MEGGRPGQKEQVLSRVTRVVRGLASEYHLSPVWDKLANTMQPLAPPQACPQSARPLGTRGPSHADPFLVPGFQPPSPPALCTFREPMLTHGQ